MNSASRERLAGDLPVSAALQSEHWWDEEGTQPSRVSGAPEKGHCFQEQLEVASPLLTLEKCTVDSSALIGKY